MPADADTVLKQPKGNGRRVPSLEVPVDRRSLSSIGIFVCILRTETDLYSALDRMLSVGRPWTAWAKCYHSVTSRYRRRTRENPVV